MRQLICEAINFCLGSLVIIAVKVLRKFRKIKKFCITLVKLNKDRYLATSVLLALNMKGRWRINKGTGCGRHFSGENNMNS